MQPHTCDLLRLVTKYGYERGAELGVKAGDTLFALADHGCEMIGVDLWEPQPANTGEWGETYETWPHEAHEQGVRAEAAKYPDGQVRLVKALTTLAADAVADGSLDFVYIDADHRTPAVLADIARWWPKVRRGGMLAGDDICWPSVEAAVRERFGERYHVHHRVWYVIKEGNL